MDQWVWIMNFEECKFYNSVHNRIHNWNKRLETVKFVISVKDVQYYRVGPSMAAQQRPAALQRPQFNIEERVFMVVKYYELGSPGQLIRQFQEKFLNRRLPFRHALTRNYGKYKASGTSRKPELRLMEQPDSKRLQKVFVLNLLFWQFTLKLRSARTK